MKYNTLEIHKTIKHDDVPIYILIITIFIQF